MAESDTVTGPKNSTVLDESHFAQMASFSLSVFPALDADSPSPTPVPLPSTQCAQGT